MGPTKEHRGRSHNDSDEGGFSKTVGTSSLLRANSAKLITATKTANTRSLASDHVERKTI